MSNFLRPRGLWPTRLFCSWDFPGKNTGMGCHFHFQGIILTDPGIKHYISVIRISEVTQLCPTFCNPMNCSLPGFSVQGIFQARILAWVPIASQGIFPTQGSNLGLLPCKQFLYHLSHQGSQFPMLLTELLFLP